MLPFCTPNHKAARARAKTAERRENRHRRHRRPSYDDCYILHRSRERTPVVVVVVVVAVRLTPRDRLESVPGRSRSPLTQPHDHHHAPFKSVNPIRSDSPSGATPGPSSPRCPGANERKGERAASLPARSLTRPRRFSASLSLSLTPPPRMYSLFVIRYSFLCG